MHRGFWVIIILAFETKQTQAELFHFSSRNLDWFLQMQNLYKETATN